MKTKNLLLFSLSMLVLIPLSVSAQLFGSDKNSEVNTSPSFGIKAGGNLSNVYDTQGEEFQADSKLGVAAGVFVTLPLTKYIGLQPEILFSQKGYQGSGSVLGNDYSFARTTNFIDVPLLLSIRTGEFLSILVGPQYSYLLSQNYTFKSGIVDITQDEHFDNENLLKNTLAVTGGFDINLNKLVLSARAGWDLMNNEGDGTSTTPRYKNMWYQATIGFRF